jgi:DNA-binding transcriptional LysR family regulator
MDAVDLKFFEAVARIGAISRAALELNTVQSNVTARIKALEDELSTALFQRHSRGVNLTPAGQRLLPYAERIAALLSEAKRVVEDDGTPSGSLVVGSLETTAAMRLGSVMSAFAQAHPQVDLSLKTGTTSEMVDLVLAHRIEGAFVCGPIDHPDLLEEVIFREELTLITHPSVKSLDAVFGARELRCVVMRLGCSYRQRLEHALASRGIVALRWQEIGTVDGIVACVSAGIGVSLLPRGLLDQARREGRLALHSLPANEAMVDTTFVRRRDAIATSALLALLAQARAVVGKVEAAE